MPAASPEFVYKVVSRAAADAAAAALEFPHAPIDLADGFIHFSTATQLAETLRLHFAGQDNLVVFAVRCADMGQGLRWEPSRGGALFPHHYGELSRAAIGEMASISVAADGSVKLPIWVK
jgi:uncharacterized protein (DUF952 family)